MTSVAKLKTAASVIRMYKFPIYWTIFFIKQKERIEWQLIKNTETHNCGKKVKSNTENVWAIER